MVTSAVYLALGLAWTFRSALELMRPNYWDPVTTLDWISIWSYCVALALVVIAVPLLAHDAHARPIVSAIAWVVAGGAAVTAAANGLEDGVGLTDWGTVYVAGILTMLVGSVAFAVGLYLDARSRFAGSAGLWAAGFAFMAFGFGFLVLLGSIRAIQTRRAGPATADASPSA
jgi:hypothetical protein